MHSGLHEHAHKRRAFPGKKISVRIQGLVPVFVRLLNLRTAVCWIEAACRIIARRAVQSTEKRGGVANVLALDQTSRHGEGRQQNFLPLVDWKRYRLIPEGHRACMRTYDTFVIP